MTQQDRNYIKEIAQELALAMHQSRDKEVSGLFAEIRDEQKKQSKRLDVLDSKFETRTLTEAELKTIQDFVVSVRGATLIGNATKWVVSVIVAIGSIVYMIKNI